MNKKIIPITILGFILVGFLVIFASQKPRVQSDRIQVTASFYPLYYFAQQIGGDKVDVANLTPAGAEPHEYELTTQDLVSIERSSMVILNGGGLEAWGERIQKNTDPKKTHIVVVADELTNQTVVEDGKAIADPHIWLSPVLAKEIVNKITQGFVRIDSANKDYYEANSAALKVKLDELDLSYKQGLGSCQQNNMVTSHAAFGYLAKEYEFDQVAIAGISPDEEPSPQQLASTVQFVKSHNIKYIFFESLVSPKLSETIATETGATTLVLDPLEGLTYEQISQGENYFTQMQKNLTNLHIALQCTK